MTGSVLGTTSPLTDQQLDRRILEEFRSQFSDPYPSDFQLLSLFHLIAKHSGNTTFECRLDVLVDRMTHPSFRPIIEDAVETQSLGRLRTMMSGAISSLSRICHLLI